MIGEKASRSNILVAIDFVLELIGRNDSRFRAAFLSSTVRDCSRSGRRPAPPWFSSGRPRRTVRRRAVALLETSAGLASPAPILLSSYDALFPTFRRRKPGPEYVSTVHSAKEAEVW